ncbi:MAG: hypothetical protein RIK87_26425 [Fuerstiella sp.]
MKEDTDTQQSGPPDEKLTQIVSYLDGELDDTQMNEVEQGLINDPDMRSHADILSRTWALLDSLEDVSASGQFTQDTLATIAAETVRDQTADPRHRFRYLKEVLARYHVVPCFLAGVIGGVVGLTLSAKAWEKRQQSGREATNRIVLDNLDLLQNAELYSVVPNEETLITLQLPTGTDVSPPTPDTEKSDE